MATAQIWHLLNLPSVTPATDPDPGVGISATSPARARLTTQLLDPAIPAAGTTQYLADLKYNVAAGAGAQLVIGRWITRQLPAQTIGAGNWSFYGALRVNDSGSSADINTTLFGFAVAQWRAGTGVVARFVDSPGGGTNVAAPTATYDRAQLTTIAGGALTLSANDQIALEVWFTTTNQGTLPWEYTLLTNGLGQFGSATYAYQALTDTDAILKAPAAITYQ